MQGGHNNPEQGLGSFFFILGALDMRKCLTPGTGCNFRVFGALDMIIQGVIFYYS